MSNVHQLFPVNHRVFQGGRYLKAIHALPDLDIYEQSILLYLGSLMPFDKGFVDQVAWPSIETIAKNTRMSNKTVQKKINSLVRKKLLTKKQRILINQNGRFEQLTNDYTLTEACFTSYEDVINSQEHISAIRKRAVGESSGAFFTSSPLPPPTSLESVGEVVIDEAPTSEIQTNSPAKAPKEDPNISPFSYESPEESCKSEIDNIIAAWEEVVKKAVSPFERRRFLTDYRRTRSNELLMLEKIREIENDPYLLERAKSINWLFSGYDLSLKTKKQLLRTGNRAIERLSSADQFDDIVSKLPRLLANKSQDFLNPSPELIESMFGNKLDEARKRLKIEPKPKRPENIGDLKILLDKISFSQDPSKAERAKQILNMLPTAPFGSLLPLYIKYCEV